MSKHYYTTTSCANDHNQQQLETTMQNVSTVHFSSKSDDWPTPTEYFARLSKLFNFTLDPACSASNAKCPNYFTAEQDGLAQSWRTDGAVFLNPPYGRTIGKWVQKAYEESQKGTPVVCLLPARTDTAWWQNYCTKGLVKFVRGRLKFGDATNSAPFPSAIVIFANLDNAASADADDTDLFTAA